MGSIFKAPKAPKAPKALKPQAPIQEVEEAKLQVGGSEFKAGTESLIDRLTIKRKKPTNTLNGNVGLGKI